MSRGTTRGMGWQKAALKAAMERDSGLCLAWVYAEAKVIALSAYDHEGGYGRVRKVRIKGMDKIPDYIHFAGKTSKAKTPLESRVQWSTEALACPLNHSGIIKFWTVHATTMEAYTLWWNGDSLREMAMLNLKVSPTTPTERIKEIPTLQEEQVRRITLY
jgi:hypothetical protein